MRKRLIAILLLLAIVLSGYGCSDSLGKSKLTITFIDVGQGDSALIECDNHFMLIDGGDTDAADEVRRVLEKNKVTKLDVLVASHLDKDHIGGLVEGLDGVRSIKHTLSNSKSASTKVFKEFQQRIQESGSQIKVPKIGATYKLGRAEIQVIDVRDQKRNDSLVLLVTYGNTTFLFAGDIEQDAQKRVADALRSPELESKLKSSKNLIKMPHHGAYNSTKFNQNDISDNYLNTLLTACYAKYFLISVGKGNQHGHPHENTLTIINQVLRTHNLNPNEHFFRTDVNGDVVVESDGENLTIKTTRN